jgi:hypothetical protein
MAWNDQGFSCYGIDTYRSSRLTGNQNAYLPSRITWPILFVTLASLLDAYCTLVYIQAGGREANPLMTLALQGGEGIFIFVKMLLTGYGSYLLARCWYSPLAMKSLYCLSLIYAGLLLVHVSLLL